jgi:hypothetical protein
MVSPRGECAHEFEGCYANFAYRTAAPVADQAGTAGHTAKSKGWNPSPDPLKPLGAVGSMALAKKILSQLELFSSTFFGA